MQDVRATRAELGTVALCFAVLTCVVTYPQIRTLSSHVGAHYDALFGIWRLAWIAHQLVQDPVRLFDANIFYPEQNTLAYSDAALLLGLAGAPLIWTGIEPVVVYNMLVLLGFVTAGTAMYALARTLTGSAAGAWVAALIFAFQPYRFAHFPQIELLWTCWIPLALLALRNVLMTRRITSGLALGVAVSCQAWSCLYYAVFLVTGLAAMLLVTVLARPRPEVRGLVRPMLAAAAVTLVLFAPYAVPYLSTRESVGVRSIKNVREWSPSLQNYLATTQTSLVYRGQPARVGHIEGVLFPGFVAAGLAVVGLIGGRKETIAFAAMLLLSFDLSLGVNGFLYPLARSLLLPYQGLRVPARMFVMVSASMSVLAAYGARRLVSSINGLWRHAATAALAGVIVIEGLAVPLPLHSLPSGPTRVYRFLALQPPATILEWPLPNPRRLGITQEPERMYFSTLHWQRLVNGYSGHYPSSYVELLHVAQTFPDPQSLEYLRRRRVRYVILHSARDPNGYLAVLIRLRADPDVEVMITERVEASEVTLIRVRGV